MQTHQDFIKDLTAYMKRTAEFDNAHTEIVMKNPDAPAEEAAGLGQYLNTD